MTKKIDKIHRQQTLLERINKDTYNTIEFMTEFHIQERTIRRDLNELAEKGEIYSDRLSILRKRCLGKLTRKVDKNKLSNALMVTLVLSGEVKKAEIKTETTIQSKQEVTFKFDELNKDEREFCRKIARRYIKRNNQKRPTTIH